MPVRLDSPALAKNVRPGAVATSKGHEFVLQVDLEYRYLEEDAVITGLEAQLKIIGRLRIQGRIKAAAAVRVRKLRGGWRFERVAVVRKHNPLLVSKLIPRDGLQ